MDITKFRNIFNQYLHDAKSPGKIDKNETVKIQEKITANGEKVSPAVKEFIKDQIAAGKFEKGSALTSLENLIDPPKSKKELLTDEYNKVEKEINCIDDRIEHRVKFQAELKRTIPFWERGDVYKETIKSGTEEMNGWIDKRDNVLIPKRDTLLNELSKQ